MSIGSIVNLAAGKISDLLVQEAKLLYGVEDQVRSLQRELTAMNAFLVDMEAKDEEGGDELCRTTITEIRNHAYDAEDVIDSYIFEANFPIDKTEAFFKRYVCLCSSLPHTHQVGSEIEAINARIAETMGRWKRFAGPSTGGINRTDDGARPNRDSRTRPPAYSHTEEEHVVGLEEDINKLAWMLTTDDPKIQVLSILGMGGSGKTTLARKLYNHESVKGHFNCIAWLTISKVWVAQHILVELLRQVTGETMRRDEGWTELLVENLHQYLNGKKYLIVLDDVWEKQALREIFPALPDAGRRIIITTRKREVVDFVNMKSFIHEPRHLTEEESWDLFRKKALNYEEENNNSMDMGVLETLGKEMLKKCEGLPLAVIALAGILSKKKTPEDWGRVKSAVSSWIFEKGDDTHYGPVNEMLTLSYNDLRLDLKPCFLYLALFQEDTKIQTRELINMWIAEGFITSNMCKEGETLEDVARDYLEELIDRCVVQIASKSYQGNVKSIRVHDLVRDLCIKKAKQQVFLEMSTSQSSDLHSIVSDLRRTAIYSLEEMYLPLPIHSPHLRSLIYEAVQWDFFGEYETMSLTLKPIHQNFRLLRVLNLIRIKTSDGILPTGIGSLIHLRYLGLRDTYIYKLPASLGNLRTLLTLECTQGLYVHKFMRNIPNVLWKIEGLRHLSFDCAHPIKGRVKLHTLKHLQTLKGIGGGSWVLEELPHLSTTVQNLKLRGISSEEQLEAAFRCPSIKYDGLRSLGLEWNDDPERGKVVMLENLQPISHCQHLRKLYLMGRIQDRLNSCNQIPASIVKLELRRTWFKEEAELAALGKLPNLMYLWLNELSYMGAKWTVLAGHFTQLKYLHLSYLIELEECSIQEGAMPQLSKLEIYGCRKLRRLPQGLRFITTLQELQLWDMGDEFKQRAKGGEDEEEYAHISQHVPQVHIDNSHDVLP